MTHPAKPPSTGILRVRPAGVPPAGSAPTKDALLTLFRKTGALLDGHFVLRSGLHSRQYFQCAILLQHTDIAARVCGWLADKLREFDCDAVISPALGGIIVGQEVGCELGKRHIFVEKEDGKLVLRRGFQIEPNEKFIVVEDVVTRGGRVQETIDIVRANGGIVSAVGVIVDRSGKVKPNFGCPFVSLVEMNVETLPRTISRQISPQSPPSSRAASRRCDLLSTEHRQKRHAGHAIFCRICNTECV